MNIKYKKNNNKCPYCKDNNYLVYGSYKENGKEVFQCFCKKYNRDFNVIKEGFNNNET